MDLVALIREALVRDFRRQVREYPGYFEDDGVIDGRFDTTELAEAVERALSEAGALG